MNKQKTIDINEQRIIMLMMLEYVDSICREHGIKYSLIGGSLIGAVRHVGFIPWDDDLDIILTKNNYDKLMALLDKETGRYQILRHGHGGERFSFAKLVDTRTRLIEVGQKNTIQNYGIYIDIFCYYPTSNNKTERIKHCKRLKFLRSVFIRNKINLKGFSLKRNLCIIYKNSISYLLGYNKLNSVFATSVNKYINEDSEYCVSNWPTYAVEKEIQLKKNTEEYIDAKFENLTVMIFKNYDEILKTTFGDYMQLPPESERIPKHNIKMWWREGCEDEVKELKARTERSKKNA